MVQSGGLFQFFCKIVSNGTDKKEFTIGVLQYIATDKVAETVNKKLVNTFFPTVFIQKVGKLCKESVDHWLTIDPVYNLGQS